MQQASARQPVPEQGYRSQIAPSLIISSKNRMRVPKSDGRSQLHFTCGRVDSKIF